MSYIKYGANSQSRRIASRLIGAAAGAGGSGSGGSSGSGGASGASMSSGGSNGGSISSGGSYGGSVSSSGAIGTAGSGTTCGNTTGGGSGQPPIAIKCSVTNVREGRATSGAGSGFASLLAIAGLFARRRRRDLGAAE
ncbi:MAG: hypothetical protein WDO69_02885 [Pseudomonadota bacterium]